jgi:ABC-type amino acid transport substrate-binding protein
MARSLPFDDPVSRFESFDSTVDGVRGLLDGRFDAVVALVPVAQYWIRRLGTDAVWMQATLPMKVPFGMAASADAVPLAGILDAVLRRVHAPERRAMLDAWTTHRGASNGAAIAGGIAGAVAPVGAATVLLVRRRRPASTGA